MDKQYLYNEGNKYEPKDVIRDWNLNFNLGSALKHLSTYSKKSKQNAMEDLLKAKTYINFEIEALNEELEASKTEPQSINVDKIDRKLKIAHRHFTRKKVEQVDTKGTQDAAEW